MYSLINFDACRHPRNSHLYQDIGNFLTLLLSRSLFTDHQKPLPNWFLLPNVSSACNRASHKWKHTFFIWLFQPSVFRLSCVSLVFSTLLLATVLLYELTTSHSSLSLLLLTWVISGSGLLRIKLPSAFSYKTFCGLMFSCLLDKYLGVEFLGLRVDICFKF